MSFCTGAEVVADVGKMELRSTSAKVERYHAQHLSLVRMDEEPERHHSAILIK